VANKVDTARKEDVEALQRSAGIRNPQAAFVRTASRIRVEKGDRIRGKRVLVIEDGPTVTHGEMPYGAGYVAAQQYGAAECVDPRPYAAESLRAIFAGYPHLEKVLPAEGYFPQQLRDLETTIHRVPCDLVLVATPIDLSRLIHIRQPSVRVMYRVEDWDGPKLSGLIKDFLREKNLIGS
jgi:predicted GTPase